MQKALILALLFGAFLFSTNLKAEDDEYIKNLICASTVGGTYHLHYSLGEICSTPAPLSSRYESTSNYNGVHFVGSGSSKEEAQQAALSQAVSAHYAYLASLPDSDNCGYECTRTYERSSSTNNISSMEAKITHTVITTRTDPWGIESSTHSSDTFVYSTPAVLKDEGAYCPPDDSPKLTFMYEDEGIFNCYSPLPLDEEDPPCEKDDFGNCIVPPDECFLTGSGSEVCYADPNEKCDVNYVNDEPVYSNCESGCGFVGENLDNFICADEPELPSLDDCLVTTNGYACPSDTPEPDDDITDPDKPNADMKKSDFKDVLKGVETRLDGTNKLLNDQIARDADNTNKLAGKLDVGNKALKGIEDNTGSAAKSLREGLYGDALEIEDDSGSILSSLGLTGDESITDLEKGVVSLSDYRDQFTWSAGSSSCPSPRSMNILNKTFSIEWDPYCDVFSVLGYFIKAAALFLSGFIAFGVRK